MSFPELYKNKAVLHSLLWLSAYLIINTITGNIAESKGIDFHMVSAVPNLFLAVICFYYLRHTGIANDIRLLTKPTEKDSVMLYYVPLLLLPFLNLFYGIKTSLSIQHVAFIAAMYIGVGFMEEVIFRGLMYRALLEKWNKFIVVIFITLTFAVGHIFSMIAISQSFGDTVLQIINSLVVGFMFMIVILASNNLSICIIAHILYNFLATISMIDSTHIEIIAANTIITLIYSIYLILHAKQAKPHLVSMDSSK